jgi:hypothetical protein
MIFARSDFVKVHGIHYASEAAWFGSLIRICSTIRRRFGCLVLLINELRKLLIEIMQAQPVLNSGICVHIAHDQFEPTPHAWIHMPLQVLIIHILYGSKYRMHIRTKACAIDAFERLEVVETAITQLS